MLEEYLIRNINMSWDWRDGLAVKSTCWRLGGGGELAAAAGHVTGKAPDGRRPSSAPPERPARPRHGVLL